MLNKLLLASLPLLSNALSFPMEDSLSSQKFNIIYVPTLNENLDSIKDANGNGTIFSLGNDMKCFIPNETKLSLLQRINNNATAWKQLLSTSLGQGLDIIDSQLDKKCIKQGNGFWKYQLCYGEDFLQYHDSPTDKNFVNKLGSYLGDPDAPDQTEITLLFDNEIGYYISEFLEPGDVCDLTGKRREVEVQYVCGLNKESPTIQWVKEIGTCLYEARVMVPDLCQLELFAKNEDKLAATEIVCERSVPEGRKNGIIDIISDFDPVFLNNEIFLLKPNDKHNEILLLYTGDFKSNIQIETVLFDIFGKAFNKIINAKLLKGPNNEEISLNDSFEWYAPVINSNTDYLFTFYLKMLPGGKAELFLKPEENEAPHFNNNFLSFTSNGLDSSLSDNKNAAKEQLKKKKSGLTLQNENGDIISVEKVADPMDQNMFVVNVVDDDGEPVPMNDKVRDELLKTLFDTQTFQDMIEQIGDEDKDDGEKIQFLHHKLEEEKPVETALQRKHEDAHKKETVNKNNLVRNIHVEDAQRDMDNQEIKEDSNSEERLYGKGEESIENFAVVDDNENTNVEQDVASVTHTHDEIGTPIKPDSPTSNVQDEKEFEDPLLTLHNYKPQQEEVEQINDRQDFDNEPLPVENVTIKENESLKSDEHIVETVTSNDSPIYISNDGSEVSSKLSKETSVAVHQTEAIHDEL